MWKYHTHILLILNLTAAVSILNSEMFELNLIVSGMLRDLYQGQQVPYTLFETLYGVFKHKLWLILTPITLWY